MIALTLLRCTLCQYEWVPRIEHPKCCPGCKSRKWNTYDSRTTGYDSREDGPQDQQDP